MKPGGDILFCLYVPSSTHFCLFPNANVNQGLSIKLSKKFFQIFCLGHLTLLASLAVFLCVHVHPFLVARIVTWRLYWLYTLVALKFVPLYIVGWLVGELSLLAVADAAPNSMSLNPPKPLRGGKRAWWGGGGPEGALWRDQWHKNPLLLQNGPPGPVCTGNRTIVKL